MYIVTVFKVGSKSKSRLVKLECMDFVKFIYTQSPIIRNGPIRLGIEFWGKFKKRALGRSNLRNA